MLYFIWIIILVLVLLAYLFSNNLFYIALCIWFLCAFFKIWQKIGDYNDWRKKSPRDEKNKLDEVADNMAKRGLAFSGMRIKKEREAKEDFKYERRARKRKLLTELFESLILK